MGNCGLALLRGRSGWEKPRDVLSDRAWLLPQPASPIPGDVAVAGGTGLNILPRSWALQSGCANVDAQRRAAKLECIASALPMRKPSSEMIVDGRSRSTLRLDSRAKAASDRTPRMYTFAGNESRLQSCKTRKQEWCSGSRQGGPWQTPCLVALGGQCW